MEEKNIFQVLDENGKEVTCEVLFTFDSEETKKSYIVYTDNTTDEAGSTKVYASIYDPTGNDKTLKPVETDAEWQIIESVFASIPAIADNKPTSDKYILNALKS